MKCEFLIFCALFIYVLYYLHELNNNPAYFTSQNIRRLRLKMLHICRKNAINFKLFDLLFPCPWTLCKPREKITILSNRPDLYSTLALHKR